jgi:hypothetical protein
VRTRLRPAYSSADLAEIYRTPHRHAEWPDHRARVAFTVLAANAISRGVTSGADLSCGDGAILRALPLQTRYLGDLAPGWDYTGPVERTIGEIPDVDLFVCAETVEHLDDPDAVLGTVRTKTQRLLLSTPVDALDDANPEHYWAWDREAVEEMLAGAGFKVEMYVAVDVRPSGGDYCFGIWACT